MNLNTKKRRLGDQVVSYETLRRFTAKTFQAVDLNKADAETCAEVLAMADAWGVFTHGTKFLADNLWRLKNGGLRPQGKPHVVSEGSGWAIVDGDSSVAMVTSTFAMQTAIDKARENGVAYVGVRNSAHYGAAGYYAWQAARQGFIGLSMANTSVAVAAPGSSGPVIGTNPISYAVPAGRYHPLMLDMSVATVAGGKVWEAQLRGEIIPLTWLLDADGKPTADPSGFGKVGALQPAAGHKGYGIALLIEILAAALPGAAMTVGVKNFNSYDPTKPIFTGAAFIAIDINAIIPFTDFIRRVEDLIDEIHNAPRAVGVERIYIPGEKEWDCYEQSLKEGIVLPADVVENLQRAAKLTGLDWETELYALQK